MRELTAERESSLVAAQEARDDENRLAIEGPARAALAEGREQPRHVP
jgi:hypothetical protein